MAPIDRETLARLGVNPDDVDRARSFNGWQADIPLLRKLHPDLMDFQTWLDRHPTARFAALLFRTGTLQLTSAAQVNLLIRCV